MDVGRWRGIGLNGPRVLVALSDGPLSTRELAQGLDLNAGNLRSRLLPRLAALGLLTGSRGRWAVVEDLPAALAAASVALGTEGKADAVKAQHEAERVGYIEHRDRTRPERNRRAEARRTAERADRVAARAAAAPTLDFDLPELLVADPDSPLENRPLCAAMSADPDRSGTDHRAIQPDPPPGHRAHTAHAGTGSAGHEH